MAQTLPAQFGFLHLIFSAKQRRDRDLMILLIAFADLHNLLTFEEWVEVGYLDVVERGTR